MEDGNIPRVWRATVHNISNDYLRKKRMQYVIDLLVINAKGWIEDDATKVDHVLLRLTGIGTFRSYADLLKIREKLFEIFPKKRKGIKIFWKHHVEGFSVKELAEQEGLLLLAKSIIKYEQQKGCLKENSLIAQKTCEMLDI